MDLGTISIPDVSVLNRYLPESGHISFEPHSSVSVLGEMSGTGSGGSGYLHCFGSEIGINYNGRLLRSDIDLSAEFCTPDSTSRMFDLSGRCSFSLEYL